jgi:hypothetical protein
MQEMPGEKIQSRRYLETTDNSKLDLSQNGYGNADGDSLNSV